MITAVNLKPFSPLDKKRSAVQLGVLFAIILAVMFYGAYLISRDNTRKSDLRAIVNAVYTFANDHNGRLPNTIGQDTMFNFPITKTCIGTKSPCFDLGAGGSYATTETIVPDYLDKIPSDPRVNSFENTQYYIYKNDDGKIVGSAVGELGTELVITK
jgi:hypothetical protein